MESNKRTDGIEVGDIFREYGEEYRRRYKVSSRIRKVMRAIEMCRTSELGGHIDECDKCGHIRISYNSCRDRHCPKCQGIYREKWIIKQNRDLLPGGYFHIVFTIPDKLNRLALVNQEVVYNILFKSASETLLQLGRDPKHLGALIGIIAILHTWGQTLIDHPHLHCVVPCGGLSEDMKNWLLPKKSRGKKKKKFFVHVDVISALFRGKFLYYLKKAYNKGELKFVGEIERLGNDRAFQDLINELYGMEWVTYCKRPFGNAEKVIKYLGRYTHRVAISNNRIVKLEDDKVTFWYRDYKDSNKNKLITLDVFEFIRRFLLHILPKRFMKIRHYGILSNKNRKTKLKRAKEILGVKVEEKEEDIDWKDLLFEITGIDVDTCPKCGKGVMVLKEKIKPASRSP